MDEREIVQLVCRRLTLPGAVVQNEYARASRFREICYDYVVTLRAWVRWSKLDSPNARQIELDYWETLQALEAEMRRYLVHLEPADSDTMKGQLKP